MSGARGHTILGPFSATSFSAHVVCTHCSSLVVIIQGRGVEGWPAHWHDFRGRNDSQEQAGSKPYELSPGLDATGFCHGKNSIPIIWPEKPPFHTRSQVWGRERGVGAKPEVSGLLSLCSVLQLHCCLHGFHSLVFSLAVKLYYFLN